MALRLFSDQVQRQLVVCTSGLVSCRFIDQQMLLDSVFCNRFRPDIVAQIANTTGIPHIEYDWKLEATRQEHLNNQMTVNVAPALSALSRAYYDIIKTNYEWRTFTLIYETPEGELMLLRYLQVKFMF